MGALTYPSLPAKPWYTGGGAILACVLLFGVPVRRRSWRAMAGCCLALFALASGMVACTKGTPSNITGNPGTTPGAYTVTITGTSGATTETGLVNIAVQ
jgi:hypothetical protein